MEAANSRTSFVDRLAPWFAGPFVLQRRPRSIVVMAVTAKREYGLSVGNPPLTYDFSPARSRAELLYERRSNPVDDGASPSLRCTRDWGRNSRCRKCWP